MIDTSNIALKPEHKVVLHGLLMQRPDTTLSDLVAEALEPFCRQHILAAGATISVSLVALLP